MAGHHPAPGRRPDRWAVREAGGVVQGNGLGAPRAPAPSQALAAVRHEPRLRRIAERPPIPPPSAEGGARLPLAAMSAPPPRVPDRASPAERRDLGFGSALSGSTASRLLN